MLLKRSGDFVIPGDIIAKGKVEAGPNTVKVGDAVISTRVGVVQLRGKVVSVNALAAHYTPKRGDKVVGVVARVDTYGWEIDIDAPSFGYLPAQSVFGRSFNPQTHDPKSVLNVGDIVLCEIDAVRVVGGPLLRVTKRRGFKLKGFLFKLTPSKIARFIGRRGSLTEALKRETGCRITIGQNGIIVVDGEPEKVALIAKALELVEEKPYVSGLTEEILRSVRKVLNRG